MVFDEAEPSISHPSEMENVDTAVDGSADAWGWQSHHPPSRHAGASAWGRTLGIKDAKGLPVGQVLDKKPGSATGDSSSASAVGT